MTGRQKNNFLLIIISFDGDDHCSQSLISQTCQKSSKLKKKLLITTHSVTESWHNKAIEEQKWRRKIKREKEMQKKDRGR